MRDYKGRDWWQPVRMELLARQHARCPACGKQLTEPVAVHHRKARSQGGTDESDNLVMLHDPCHLDAHRFPSLARERGLVVPSWGDPSDWPLIDCDVSLRDAAKQPGSQYT